MTPEQEQLQAAIAAHKQREAELHELRTQHGLQSSRLHEIENALGEAREALKQASTEAQIKKAKVRMDDLRSEYATLEIQIEGLDERAAAAEKAVDRANKDVHRLIANVAVLKAKGIEARALELAAELGPLIYQRRQLARMASSSASVSVGSLADPLGGCYPGERTPWSRRVDELLQARTDAAAITVEDLLK